MFEFQQLFPKMLFVESSFELRGDFGHFVWVSSAIAFLV